jgi:ketosteroid isomerase-like protein
MSQEPSAPDVLELTRRVYSALNARDFDAVTAMFGPTSVWDVSRWGLGAHTGLRAIRQFLRDWFGSLEHYEVHVEQMEDLGNGIVLVVAEQLARQAGQRGALRVRSAPVFIWVEGTLALVTLYPDVEEGRAAAVRAAQPSSQRNVVLHERIVEAISERADPHEMLASGFRIESRITAATDYIYDGAAGLLEWAIDLFEGFAGDVNFAVKEILAAGDDFVVASFAAAGRALRSTEPVELHWVGVTWFRDQKATRHVGFTSREDALKAVGLSE